MKCHYPLRGLATDACPECGRQFDPGIPATYTRPGIRRFQFASWAKPPSLWTISIVIILVSWCLIAASDPAWEFLVLVRIAQWTVGRLDISSTSPLIFSVIIVIAIDSIIRLIAVCRTHRLNRYRRELGAHRRRWRWAVLPIAMLFIASPYFYNWPLKIRFELSKPAFEREIKAMKASGKKSTRFRYVGLYKVTLLELSEDTWDCLAPGPAGQTPNVWIYTGSYTSTLTGPFTYWGGVMFHYRETANSPAPDPAYWLDCYHPELASPPWYIYSIRP